jgi:hypothetical protein
MAKVRKIKRTPEDGFNYFLVDTNFLVNKHIPEACAPVGSQRQRVVACQAWWDEIDHQLDAGCAIVYVPDVCIAEAFKTLAKKRWIEKWLTAPQYEAAKKALSKDIRIPASQLRSTGRTVRFHDLSTNRDIIISVDRFFEVFMKRGKTVQVADLIFAATAKHLLDFFAIPKARLHLVTLDNALREGIGLVAELPNAYDPTRSGHRAEIVFEETAPASSDTKATGGSATPGTP